MNVVTKDCTALNDSELVEMADISAINETGWEVGVLSKLKDEWVLVTSVFSENRLMGFAFASLERIGGTPALLIPAASFIRGADAEEVMNLLMSDLYRRVFLAFPDEDVLVCTKMTSYLNRQAYSGLQDVVPRHGYKPTGEQRAWGRRIAKRFSLDSRIDDKTFVVEGDSSPVTVFDYAPIDRPVSAETQAYRSVFEEVDTSRFDCVICFGWAMAEDLAEGALPGR
ncbi:MAG: hypothetical protein M1374_06935 [Firmicutes bacterium]|jgi:hypothetical protein|nr:hypothetical protein [Bacillota bacterium]